jgi:S-DNA-T family DNA segregation ATPase FtsK/SpoIIIE
MASKKSNNFRNAADDFQPEPKPKKKSIQLGRWSWLKDEQTLKIMGVFFILFSLFLLLSFVSHIINLWGFETDQDILQSKSWKWYKANNVQSTANLMGYIGAWFGHLFIHKWFGIASFVLIFSFFTLGTKFLFNWQMYPLPKILRYTFFIVVWISLTMGFVFHSHNIFMGGGFGYFGSSFLMSLLGKIGVVFFLLLYALCFAILVYNIDFKWNKSIVGDFIDDDHSNAIKVPFSEHELEAEKIKNEYINDQSDASIQDEDEGLELIVLNQNNEIEEEILSTTLDEASQAIPLNLPSQRQNVKEKEQKDFELKIEEAKEEEIVEIETKPVEVSTINQSLEGDQYDPKLDLGGYQMPTIDLLQDYEVAKTEIDRTELEHSKNLIIETLKNYNIGISEIKANIGPTVTLYEIIPAPGVKISRIKNLEDDIALSLAALGIRIIAPIPGKGTIGIEVPNKKPEMVPMRSMVASKKFQESTFELPVILGKTISNEIYIADLAKMPHLLCAGATGQGKSVGLNTIICSLLYKKHPSELKFVLIDPKKVELTLYNKIERHFLAKLPGDGDAIITDTKLVTNTLNSLCMEMDDRYDLLKSAGKRNIIEYNTKFKERKLLPTEGHRFLPYIVVVIDEVADLMMTAGREVETPIARLAQLARAVGIHVILATQRPSVNIITGTIKANFPARLAFRVTSKIDSRTILDSNGADQLIGKGDMLFSTGNDLLRLQCPFVDTPRSGADYRVYWQPKGLSKCFDTTRI